MSDYLYNIVARTFGLTETAQPLVTLLFEPPRDFKPVDTLQTSAPAEEQTAAPEYTESRPRLSSLEPAQEQKGVPSPSTSHVEPQSKEAPAPLPQLLFQREEQPAIKPDLTPPAPIQTNVPISKSAEHAPPPAQTIHTTRHVTVEPSAVKNPTLENTSPKKESKTEAQSFINATPRESAQPAAQIPHVLEPFAERKAVERALSTERPPARLNVEPSSEQRPPGLPQKINAAPLDRLPPKATESNSPVEINNVTHQRSETVIVQPQVSRFVETQPPNSSQARVAEGEQIVQVTIGRIEVRAAQPPPARQKERQKSAQQPSQSLEEYLRQRAQGGGRR